MLSVRCPTIFMAVDRGTPARSRFRTAVRRKSWGMRSGIPAFVHAVTHARRKDLIGFPERWNIQGMIAPVVFSSAMVRSRWRSRTARRSGVSGNCRPSPFLVSPGSRRSHPLRKSTWAHRRVRISDFTRQPRALGDLKHSPEILGEMGQHGIKLAPLEEASSSIALLQHGDVGPANDLA